MTFAQPWALALAALVVPLVAAYLFRLHHQKRPVSSTLLLRVLRDPQPAARRARAKLRHRLSLALLVAGLLLAVLALARPTVGGRDWQRVIVVLDTSASMGTRDGDGSRLGRAADQVEALAEGLGPRDQLALISTGARGALEVPPTTRHASVVMRARELAAAGAAGDHGGDELAARLAEALCRERGRSRVVVVSDGAGLTLPAGSCPRQRVAVGHPAENLGVSALSARLVDGLGAHDVHLAVTSSAPAVRNVRVTLAVDDVVLDVVPLEVPATGTVERTVRVTIEPELREAQGAAAPRLRATLTGPARDGEATPDALAADDVATIALPDAGPVSVLLVTKRPGSLVASALRVHPRAVPTVAAPDALPPGPFNLILVEDAPAAPLPPSGHVVAFGLVLDGAPLGLGAAARERGVVRWDFDAAWFRYVDLRDLYLTAARVVTGGRPIIDSASGALAAIGRWGDRELIVTGFGVGESDLGLRAAFPNLIANFIDWAAPAAAVAAPPTGVLAAAESELTPRATEPTVSAAGAAGGGGVGLFSFAVVAAIAFLLGEQALTLARRARAS